MPVFFNKNLFYGAGIPIVSEAIYVHLSAARERTPKYTM